MNGAPKCILHSNGVEVLKSLRFKVIFMAQRRKIQIFKKNSQQFNRFKIILIIFKYCTFTFILLHHC